MKNSKLGLVALCGILLAFSACKKDKDEKKETLTPNNSFVLSNTNYATTYALVREWNPDPETELMLMNKPTLVGATNFNLAWFDFRSNMFPAAGTYTYKAYGDGFDTTKNFDDVIVGYNLNYTESEDISGGTSLRAGDYDASGSTISISKNGDSYAFVYDVKLLKDGKTTEVKGQYKGSITKQD